MNNIIPQNNKNKRYLPHEIKTRIYAVQMYRNCGDISYVCRKYHISRISLWRWNNKYDGTVESLMDKSHRPHSKHPNGHTNQEIRYTRTIPALYRMMKRLNIKFYEGMKIKNTSKKKHNKKYETPKKHWRKRSNGCKICTRRV